MRGERGNVVSLTPHAVERDSRTFKQAASFARLGYKSVVVEGGVSSMGELPFEVRSSATTVSRRGRASQAARRLRLAADAAVSAVTARYAAATHARAMFLRRNGLEIASALPPASLYVLHGPSNYPGLFLRARHAPFIYDAHDFYPVAWEENDPVHSLLMRLERRCILKASAFVTATEGAADLYEDRYGRRPTVVRNLHDPRIDEQVRHGLRDALGLDDEAFLIVMIGNAKEGTAVEEALEGMLLLRPHVHLAFVGNYWETWRDRIAAVGLADRVHLVPARPPTQVAPFIADADLAAVLYYPLTDDYRYALPNRLFIPIAVGLPVLYPSGLPELGRLVSGYGLGIPFDSRSPGSFAEAVRRVADDRSLLAPYRAAAVRAREELSWEREEERLAVIVDRAISGGTV